MDPDHSVISNRIRVACIREARNAESIDDIAEIRERDSDKVIGYGANGPLQFITIEEYEALEDQAEFDALLEEAIDERRALGMAE